MNGPYKKLVWLVQAFLAYSNVCGYVWSLPFVRQAPTLFSKHYARLKKPAANKHLQTFVSYRENKMLALGPSHVDNGDNVKHF